MADQQLDRLRVLESVSAMKAQETEPKFSTPPKFDRSTVDPTASMSSEKEKLKEDKAKFETAIKDYRALVGRRWAADKKNLDSYQRIRRLEQETPFLKESVRTQQAKLTVIAKEGEKRLEEIKKADQDLRGGLGKEIENLEASILEDEKVLAEKETEARSLRDDLAKLTKHRASQKEQLAAIRDMISIQKKLGSAKEQQREHALGHLKKQRENQSLKLEEKEAQIKEYETMATDLKSRDESLKQHLSNNAPILESYLEKEGLMKKQVELLKTREKLAKEGLRNAESRNIQSVFKKQGDSQLSKLKAANAAKAAQCKALREKLKVHS